MGTDPGSTARDRLARHLYVSGEPDAPTWWQTAGAQEWDEGLAKGRDVADCYTRADQILAVVGDVPIERPAAPYADELAEYRAAWQEMNQWNRCDLYGPSSQAEAVRDRYEDAALRLAKAVEDAVAINEPHDSDGM